ncbi:MAG TPA: chaperone NapD [Cellvibrionaceae bacterium]
MNTASNRIDATPINQPPLHIASMALHVLPAHLTVFKAWLTTQSQVEIHAESAEGKVVVVMETSEQRAISQWLDDASQQPGVINAALVYHEILTEETSA